MPNIEIPPALGGLSVARRAMFLAYEASTLVGMGHLQARFGVTEADVSAAMPLDNYGPNGYTGYTLYADYLFGRMMKLAIHFNDRTIVDECRPLSLDYQSWARVYPTFDALIAAAIKSLTPVNH